MDLSLSPKHLLTAIILSLASFHSLASLYDCKNPLSVPVKGPVIMKFCEIPANPRVMIGGDKSGEIPARARAFKAFHMGQFEVTQLQYKIIMDDRPWVDKQTGKVKDNAQNHPSQPAVYVSYFDARRFIAKLNELNKHNKKFFYRLPTEAEWEYATRGTLNRNYYWGDKMDEQFAYAIHPGRYGWHGQDVSTCPNKKWKPGYCANQYGLMHMTGNVWELTEDDYEDNYYRASKNGHIPTQSLLTDEITKVVRGGSIKSNEDELRSTKRAHIAPRGKSSMVGFRIVRVPKSLNDVD